jgi:hypothetical protein
MNSHRSFRVFHHGSFAFERMENLLAFVDHLFINSQIETVKLKSIPGPAED